MPSRSPHFCNHHGCNKLVTDTYCEEHTKLHTKQWDKARGTAQERGYDWRWRKYSQWFLKQPENQICKLHLPGCTLLAECVDHIRAHKGQGDPNFWNPNNLQAACIHCNSVKGNKTIRGEYEL